MSKNAVTQLPEKPDGDVLSAVCANPRCDEVVERHTRRGRPRDYHDDACRQAAWVDRRQLESRLRHFEEQARILRERYEPYRHLKGDSAAPASDDSTQPTPEQIRQARETLSKIEGVVRFVRKNDDELAADLVELYDAVAPVVRSHA